MFFFIEKIGGCITMFVSIFHVNVWRQEVNPSLYSDYERWLIYLKNEPLTNIGRWVDQKLEGGLGFSNGLFLGKFFMGKFYYYFGEIFTLFICARFYYMPFKKQRHWGKAVFRFSSRLRIQHLIVNGCLSWGPYYD